MAHKTWDRCYNKGQATGGGHVNGGGGGARAWVHKHHLKPWSNIWLINVLGRVVTNYGGGGLQSGRGGGKWSFTPTKRCVCGGGGGGVSNAEGGTKQVLGEFSTEA